jgi:hypothetical protein
MEIAFPASQLFATTPMNARAMHATRKQATVTFIHCQMAHCVAYSETALKQAAKTHSGLFSRKIRKTPAKAGFAHSTAAWNLLDYV